ncbi:peptide chain release factor 3 [Ammoniphilus oxalaticus]|uniref:Peptide chain release factor 3 n=1 Tax=Ammoniphilus oxalaticus TaxID=66863 RepID=A0A419SFQ7_9BACL|nr:peptide chain release factor 3 [Ammoniphilus oxalaticus]RKD22616.1 peptide chain release factor 3 [Ammoniphilus oxalaticus]
MTDKNKNNLKKEIERRRTFAIISHPDAGKTTLTEKLLLFGGAIRLAGAVKGRKAQKTATSDWMEIEKQRGISVTSSAMQFTYQGIKVNILDTPGHQDFSEDTYRTVTAADCAVMLLDASRGVEEQTKKLFAVCRMRGIPIFTFINKLDRDGKEPLELLEELEEVLDIRSCPMNWPIGMGHDFKGIYDRNLNRVELYKHGSYHERDEVEVVDGNRSALLDLLGESLYEKVMEDIELLDIAGDPFDMEQVQKGELTPVFFGSAINNFGVQTFLDHFLKLAPAPVARVSDIGPIEPTNEHFSGYVFKIQANMNPAHRDRIAFLRICSGVFTKGMAVSHVRAGKTIKLSQPQQFFAQDREMVEDAYPGDIIGLYDPGVFKIGDTLCAGANFVYDEMPEFAPEHFARVTVKDAMKYKQYHKGVDQLTDEGAIQIYRSYNSGMDEMILGVVGVLQYEVFEYRMKAEYGVDVTMQHLPYEYARWIGGTKKQVEGFAGGSNVVVRDKEDRLVALFQNEFGLRWAQERYPELEFYDTPLK